MPRSRRPLLPKFQSGLCPLLPHLAPSRVLAMAVKGARSGDVHAFALLANQEAALELWIFCHRSVGNHPRAEVLHHRLERLRSDLTEIRDELGDPGFAVGDESPAS